MEIQNTLEQVDALDDALFSRWSAVESLYDAVKELERDSREIASLICQNRRVQKNDLNDIKNQLRIIKNEAEKALVELARAEEILPDRFGK